MKGFKTKDLRYLGAFLIPLLCWLGITYQGMLLFLAPIFAFILVPILELFVPRSKENIAGEIKQDKFANKIFDWLLYINIPIVYFLLISSIQLLNRTDLAIYEYVGLIISLAIVFGACGINVAHELGHRKNRPEKTMASILLLPSFYMHFTIEHNHGHHKMVATPEDPATARYNESVYAFYIRSIFNSYLNAWKIENKRLSQNGHRALSWRNKMIWFSSFQFIYIVILANFSWLVFFILLIAGIGGILLLETINYIEHYGLVRTKTESGRYERVMPKHSWNSNHEIGRVVLYELTRHSAHHFNSTQKFQVLEHKEDALQLPIGYPGSMVLSLVPFLWFKVMNPRIIPNSPV